MNNTQKISCDQNFVQSCPQTCTPKLKYFGITDSMILSTELDSNGNIKTLNIDPCYPNPPILTVKDGIAMYYSEIDGEYVDFDSTLYDNIYVKINKNNVGFDKSTYSFSIEPLNCSEKATISNITLYKPSDYYIKSVSNDGLHIELSTPISQSISDLMNENILNLMNYDIFFDAILLDKKKCQESFFLNIKNDEILSYSTLSKYNINSINLDSKYNKYKVNSIEVNPINKPPLSVSNGKLQYLDSFGEYKNFDSYDNIEINIYDVNSIFNKNQNQKLLVPLDFILQISPLDPSKPMILADKVVFPFQNYEIQDILNDGTIEFLNPFSNLANINFFDL